MSANPRKTEEKELASLMGGEDLKGYEIREWSLGQLVRLSPILEGIADRFMAKGVTWAKIESLFDDKKEGQEGPSAADAMAIVTAILPFAVDFLAISLRRPPEEIKALDSALAGLLIMKVVGRNVEHLAHFFAAMTQGLTQMIPTTLSGAGSPPRES